MAALAELAGLHERNEGLAPRRALELAIQTITSAMKNPDPGNEALPLVISSVQSMAPGVFGDLITGLVRSNAFEALMNRDADRSIVQWGMLLRAQLARELGLVSCSELMELDSSVRYWVEARQALAKAQLATKPAEYLRLTQAAQAADRMSADIIQQLRARHLAHVPAVQVRKPGTTDHDGPDPQPSRVRSDESGPAQPGLATAGR
jgi:hypothetical protein